MSAPSTRTSPDVGTTSPISIAIVVVLPAPLPPSNAVVVPRASAKSMPSTAVTLPNAFLRPLTRTVSASSATGTAWPEAAFDKRFCITTTAL